ncbi:hypothetical protein FRC17_003604 [Serendipita sp. 399]|nr:hypothetical protein FRC17_003604 [Serendipita sp. 399]
MPKDLGPSLLDNISKKIAQLPGSRTLTASVIVSQPRKSPASVFPYAPSVHDAEVYIQDILALVAEDVHTNKNDPGKKGEASESETPASGPVYVSAVELVLYTLPRTSSAIIYVSKVDSTGQGKRPSPTKALVVALLEHLTSRWFGENVGNGEDETEGNGWNIWIHLFARAQNQYLFPASIEFSGKQVLSDVGLVKWWKGVLDQFTDTISISSPAQASFSRVLRYVTVPGLTPLEVNQILPKRPSDPSSSEWVIGNPYSNTSIMFPMDVTPPCSISQLIPYFPDDPKARLIDEIANTTSRASATVIDEPRRKKRKLNREEKTTGADERGTEEHGETSEAAETSLDFVQTVSAEEFWERMDGRQECRLSTVAFFVVCVDRQSAPLRNPVPSRNESSSPAKRVEVAPGMVKKIATMLDSADFGTIERSMRSTAVVQDAIKALAGGSLEIRTAGPEEGTPAAHNSSEGALLEAFITRCIQVNNPEPAPKVEVVTPPPVVTVLTARKKKKPTST